MDKSVLVDRFRQHWVPLFDWWVPRWVPANFITIGSSICMWVALACIVRAESFSATTLAVTLAVLLHTYVIYDHVDGMQAKKTGSSSALGEYLDHSLDVYHGSIAVLAVFALIGFDHRALVLAMLACTHLAFAATMVEEKERGELFFGVLGSLEGVLLFIGFLLSWTWPAARAWWQAPLIGSAPAYTILVVGGGLGALVGTADCLRRIGRVPGNFALFAAGTFLLTAGLGFGIFPFWGAVAVMMAHAGDYAGRVIGSHLLGRSHPRPDLVAPAASAVAALCGCDGTLWFIGALLLWLAVRALWGIAGVLAPLRRDWRWTLSAG